MYTKSINTMTLLVGALFLAFSARAEILAMVDYESKPEKAPGQDGIAVIDVDPNSPDCNKIVIDIRLPMDSVAHHIFN